MNFLAFMTPVVKNLLIINVLMFLVKLVGQAQGFDLDYILGGYVFDSPFFEPFQVVTHMFMHGSFFHLLFNMIGLIFFGSMLERVWGPKRFFIFYFITGVGAFILYQAVGYFEFSALKQQLAAGGIDMYTFKNLVGDLRVESDALYHINQYLNRVNPSVSIETIESYIALGSIPMIGASGAVFGLLAGAAMIFPNTQVQLLFPPIPIKIKWLAIIYIGFEVYNSTQTNVGDNVAHFAHVTGAVVGLVTVLIFQRNKKTFY